MLNDSAPYNNQYVSSYSDEFLAWCQYSYWCEMYDRAFCRYINDDGIAIPTNGWETQQVQVSAYRRYKQYIESLMTEDNRADMQRIKSEVNQLTFDEIKQILVEAGRIRD